MTYPGSATVAMYLKGNEASYHYKYIALREVYILQRNQKFAENA